MAAPLVRTDWLEQAPAAAAWVRRLAGTIDAETMQRLNAKVAVEGMSYAEVASAFLDAQPASQRAVPFFVIFQDVFVKHTATQISLTIFTTVFADVFCGDA